MNTKIDSMVEVILNQPDDFLKIKETLTRIGVASKKDNTLYQSCHILHKQGRYYIVHFKELFALDGKPSNFSENDEARRNAIVKLLQEWSLLTIKHSEVIEDLMVPVSHLKIISFKDKPNWNLVSKYNIGHKNKDE
tara:strand:+ start:1079 stop:1486 length:408 start_codon:yes stop_codon:yes gene_type:complete